MRNCTIRVAKTKALISFASLFSPMQIVGFPMGRLKHGLRKPMFCICENKDADQLCSNCTADLRLCFRYSESTIPLLVKSKISTF